MVVTANQLSLCTRSIAGIELHSSPLQRWRAILAILTGETIADSLQMQMAIVISKRKLIQRHSFRRLVASQDPRHGDNISSNALLASSMPMDKQQSEHLSAWWELADIIMR